MKTYTVIQPAVGYYKFEVKGYSPKNALKRYQDGKFPEVPIDKEFECDYDYSSPADYMQYNKVTVIDEDGEEFEYDELEE